MKRLFSIFVLALTLGMSSLSANAQVAQVQTSHTQFQQSDADFLFGKENVNVAMLSQGEMEETKGKFFISFLIGLAIGVALGLVSWGIECGTGGACDEGKVEWSVDF
ncbi:hypothetical protein CQA53_02675 [Helicobacter didelphidarum]|uniref:Uncharacterized protein n=1 Tax=Helicobacter didelphidarum TaxID=2040648 RepID=A0A3D8IN46_9HELI|nr:hypothetical protein [Helicobacter didelphidarum]RDU66697.1 hypothetical protein CQA53_02675 [Helicobacter didelphidarum]